MSTTYESECSPAYIASELNSSLSTSPAKDGHIDRIVQVVMSAYPVATTDKRVRESAKAAARQAVSTAIDRAHRQCVSDIRAADAHADFITRNAPPAPQADDKERVVSPQGYTETLEQQRYGSWYQTLPKVFGEWLTEHPEVEADIRKQGAEAAARAVIVHRTKDGT